MSKIKRSQRNTPFVLINKESLQDKSISWQAKGLLSYLLSLPDDWQILVVDLANRSTNGKDSTGAILNELIKAGYIERQKIKDEKNRFSGYDYTVFDTPKTAFPKTAFPFTESPKTGKPQLLSNNNTNKEETKSIGTPPHKTDLEQLLESSEIETLKPYEVYLQNYHFNNWTESLKEAFYSFCNDKYEKSKKFSGTQAKEIIRQIEIDILQHGAETVESGLRFCLISGWNYKISFFLNANESKASQKADLKDFDIEKYIVEMYNERDVERFRSEGKILKWKQQYEENCFKLSNVSKVYKNNNLSTFFFFEIMYMPLGDFLNGSNPSRKFDSFLRIFDKQSDYNKEKADFRKIIKAAYEKQKA